MISQNLLPQYNVKKDQMDQKSSTTFGPKTQRTPQRRNAESGQTFVEFMFLLIFILIFSQLFTSGLHRGLENLWEDFANIVIKGNRTTNPNPVSMF